MNLAVSLAVSSAVKRPEWVAETKRALSWGIRALEREGQFVELPGALKAVVWRLLQDAADTLSRLPDRERVWLLAADRVCWPEVLHTAQEHYEAELQRLVELKEDPQATRLRRLAITDPTAINRMLTVLDWLQHVRGKTPARIKRDKIVVLAMAQGQPTQRIRAIMGDKGDSAARMVRGKVLTQIGMALKSTCKLTDVASNCVKFPR